MTDPDPVPIPTEVVEARLRATLQQRATDIVGDAGAGAAVGSGAGVGRHPLRWLAAAAAVVVAVGVTVAVWSDGDDDRDVVTAAGTDEPDEPDEPVASTAMTAAPVPPTCDTTLPGDFTVNGTTGGPIVGPAPGQPPADPGQLVLHWLRADGPVEARWPAPAQPLYGEAVPFVPGIGMSMTGHEGGPTVLHFGGGDPDEVIVDPMTQGDVIVDALVPQAAPCDAIQFTSPTDQFTLVIEPAGSEFPLGTDDRHPMIVELRPVDVEPTEALECSGADANGTPPNRYGGPDPTVTGAEPSDVLRQYLAGQPFSVQSGYVELQEADGSITYAVAPYDAPGWTSIIHVDQDEAGNWYLAGWTSSGC